MSERTAVSDARRPVKKTIPLKYDVSGHLEVLNTHNQPTFFVRPICGPLVKCEFPEDLMHRVRDAIGRRVRVHGTTDIDDFALFPEKIAVTEMQVYSDANQPKLRDFIGVMPPLPDGMDSVAIIRAQRDAE